MGSIDRRLRALEAGRAKDGRTLSAEALRFLSDADLRTLLAVLEDGQGDGTATFEDLYAASSERSRRALEAYYDAFEAARRGEEPPDGGPPSRSPPPDGTEDVLELLRRAEAGDEEARKEAAGRNGYRIWKHYKK